MEGQFCSSIMMNLGLFPVRFRGNIVLREITKLIDYSYKIPSSFTDELWRLPVPLYPNDLRLPFLLENAMNATHAIYVTAQSIHTTPFFVLITYATLVPIECQFHLLFITSPIYQSQLNPILFSPVLTFPFFLFCAQVYSY